MLLLNLNGGKGEKSVDMERNFNRVLPKICFSRMVDLEDMWGISKERVLVSSKLQALVTQRAWILYAI